MSAEQNLSRANVIPVSARRKTGTHMRGAFWMDRCLWVPDNPCGLSGMTPEGAMA